VTRGDVHVGLRRLLAPGRRAAVGARTGLGSVAELGRHAADPGVGTSSSSAGSSHGAEGSGLQPPEGALGGHVLPAQVLGGAGVTAPSRVWRWAHACGGSPHLVLLVGEAAALGAQAQLPLRQPVGVAAQADHGHGAHQHAAHAGRGHQGGEQPAGTSGLDPRGQRQRLPIGPLEEEEEEEETERNHSQQWGRNEEIE